MEKTYITTLHSGIASVLLTSQLLTSCGFHETILPRKEQPPQEIIGLSDDNPIAESPILYPSTLATASDQGYASDNSSQSFEPPTYTTREGHQIGLIQKQGQCLAKVREHLPTGFSSTLPLLPVYFQRGSSPEDITTSSYMELALPRQANGNNGYVAVARYGGLLGGGNGESSNSKDCMYRENERVWDSGLRRWVCPCSCKHPRSAPERPSYSSTYDYDNPCPFRKPGSDPLSFTFGDSDRKHDRERERISELKKSLEIAKRELQEAQDELKKEEEESRKKEERARREKARREYEKNRLDIAKKELEIQKIEFEKINKTLQALEERQSREKKEAQEKERASASASSSTPDVPNDADKNKPESEVDNEIDDADNEVDDEVDNEVDNIVQKVNEYLESHRNGGAIKVVGLVLLTLVEALKKDTKKSYRLVDKLIDDEIPTSAALFREKLAQHQKDLDQLRNLRKQLKSACKITKEELDSCKVKVKAQENEGFQTDSSDEDGMSRADVAFNKGVIKGIGLGLKEATKKFIEGFAHKKKGNKRDEAHKKAEIAKFITEQLLTFASPKKFKLLQKVSRTKLGTAALKIAEKGITLTKGGKKSPQRESCQGSSQT